MATKRSKGFFASKLNWTGILIALIAIAQIADRLPEPVGSWLIAAGGIATVLLRTFFTHAPVKIGGDSA